MASSILKPGTSIGNRYRIHQLLGHGESGHTYLCRDLANVDSLIALRVLAECDGIEGIASLRRELSILGRFKHPHLVHHLDFGVMNRGRTPYLVRQFAVGKDILQGSADWSVDQILDHLAGVGRVLQFLHSRGIVHRHLKPSNVILCEGDRGEITPMLLDFGLDRRTRRSRGNPLSHAYTAPEILLGHPGNLRSDLYSFGILAYQLLSRRLPFEDDDEGYLIQKHLQGKADMRPIERLKGGAGLAQVLLCLLEKDPDKRPSSADDVVRLLSAASGRDYSGSVSGLTDAYFASGRFVGREKEMVFLQERAHQVRETGRGFTVFLTGEAGAGKSRIFEELRTWALLEDWRVVEAACLPREDRSYGPYRRILAHTALLQPASDGSCDSQAIFRFEDAARIAESPQFELSSGSAAGPFRDQLTRELVRLLSDRPTMLLLHDFHWADEATVAVLDYLTSDIQAHPVFLCANLRPGEAEQGPLGRLLELSVRHQRAEITALEALPPAAVQEMIAGIIGETELAGEIAPWVHKSSGGNPFFVEEILKHLVDRKLLRRESGTWRLETERFTGLQVPSSVASVLRHRLTQLTQGAKEVTQWLALIKRAVPKDQIRVLCMLTAEDAEDHLRELLSRQIISEVGGGCFEFQHALISEVITEGLPSVKRRRMHQQIGDMLEKHGGGQESLQELAIHFTEGVRGEKPVGLALRAARACKAEFANDLALHFYEYLLKHRSFLSEERICEVTIEAADTYCALGNPKRAIRILQAQLHRTGKDKPSLAVQLYTQLSRAFQFLGVLRQSKHVAMLGIRLLRENVISNREILETQLLSQLAFCLGNESQPQKALTMLKRAACLWSNPPATLAAGHLQILVSGLYWVACNFQNGVVAAQKALAVLEPIRADHLLPMAYSHLGINLAGLGKLGKALTQHKNAALTSRRTRSLFLLAQALCNLTECYCRSGMFDEAEANSARVAKISFETENRYLAFAGKLCLLEVQIARGEWSKAHEINNTLRSIEKTSLPVYVKAQALLFSALLHVEIGCSESAISDLHKLDRLRCTETPIYEISMGETLKARICCLQGRVNEAKELLRRLEANAIKRRWAYQNTITKLELVEVLLMSGEYDAAFMKAHDSQRLAEAMPAFHLQAKAHYLQGKITVLRAEQAISVKPGVNPVFPPISESVLTSAASALKRALELSSTPHMVDTAWRIHHMMMRLCWLRSDPENAFHHAQEALRLQSLVEARVPAEVLDIFRNVEERKQAKTECEDVVRIHRGRSEKSSLSIGEMEGEHLRILCQASSAINSIRNLDPLMDAICESLLKALGMERALIALWDEKTGVLRPAGKINMRIDSLDALDSLSGHILQEVFRAGKPFVSASIRSDPRLVAMDPDSFAGSLFCAPLVSCGRTLGLLYADHHQEVENLNASTINLFAALCSIAAVAIENALAHRRLVDEKIELEHYLQQAKGDYPELVGKSASMKKLRERIRLAADSPLDVLISGESGTGKELVARALHRTGRRSAGSFVALDCGSLSDSLVESELFGYRKGAFTGAVANRPGLFEAADGGVIFLDEISNLSMRLQRKLLRVLQEREVRRIGETSTRGINVQVIAATNKNLRQDIVAGRFREDLYFRLYAMEISVPPLRERREDVPLLLEWFLDKTGRNEGGRTKNFSQEARALLLNYPYPGNVRELKKVVEGSYYSTPANIIEVAHIPAAVRDGEGTTFGWEPAPAAWQVYKKIRDGLGRFDELVKTPFLKRQIGCAQVRQLIHLALAETGGRYRDAFRLLGIPEREYAIVMQFLKRNGCYLDFRPYRKPPH